MPADADFLGKILENPADDTTRLVYADWLEEQADPTSVAKAEFLRVARERTQASGRKLLLIKFDHKLRKLAATLDPSWLAVVSGPEIENCGAASYEERAAARYAERFDYVCPKKWEGLTPTEQAGERFCEACQQTVYFCDTIREAREHAFSGHCIAVDFGLPRKPGDLRPFPAVAGMPSQDFYRRHLDQAPIDPVSAAREARKRGAESPRDG